MLVNCYPFNSVMAALDVQHIDYFSLDVGGSELDILETIDWQRLQIDVLTIENAVPEDRTATEDRLNKMRHLFNKANLYREVAILKNRAVVFQREYDLSGSTSFLSKIIE